MSNWVSIKNRVEKITYQANSNLRTVNELFFSPLEKCLFGCRRLNKKTPGGRVGLVERRKMLDAS